MRNLNVRQRIALSIGVAALGLVIGQSVATRVGRRGGWFAYTPDTVLTTPAGNTTDTVLWAAWWVLVVVVTTVAVLGILRDPPD